MKQIFVGSSAARQQLTNLYLRDAKLTTPTYRVTPSLICKLSEK